MQHLVVTTLFFAALFRALLHLFVVAMLLMEVLKVAVSKRQTRGSNEGDQGKDKCAHQVVSIPAGDAIIIG